MRRGGGAPTKRLPPALNADLESLSRRADAGEARLAAEAAIGLYDECFALRAELAQAREEQRQILGAMGGMLMRLLAVEEARAAHDGVVVPSAAAGE